MYTSRRFMAVTSCPAYEPAPKNRSEDRGVPGRAVCSLSPVPARPVQAASVKTITHRRRSRKSFPAFSKNFSILPIFYVNCVMSTYETKETAPPLRRRGFAGYVVVLKNQDPKSRLFRFLAVLALITVCIITFCIRDLPHACGDGLQGDGALQALALHFAGHLVGKTYVTVDQQVGGGAAAAAVEPGPALPAGGAGVDVLVANLPEMSMLKEPSNTLPMRYSSFPTNWWQGKMSPSG